MAHMPDFIDTCTFLSAEQISTLRSRDLVDAEDFAHVTLTRLEAPPFELSTGKASKLLRLAGVSGAAPVNNHITISHAEPADLETRIDAALEAAKKDPTKAGRLVDLGVPLVVLAADDRVDPAATKAMLAHGSTGAPVGATWQGQRIAETATLSTPPVWCSPRTRLPLQAGKDEITETPWGELKLDGLREAAFGYREGMFVGIPDDTVFANLRGDVLGIRGKIQARMKALGVKPEAMDAIVVFQRRIPARAHGDIGHDAIGRAVPLGRVGTGTLVSNLSSLLLSLFSGDELRRFLGYLPGGDDIARALPGENASAAAVATDAVMYLQRQGLICRDLRDRLVAERPRRVDDIDRVFSAAGI